MVYEEMKQEAERMIGNWVTVYSSVGKFNATYVSTTDGNPVFALSPLTDEEILPTNNILVFTHLLFADLVTNVMVVC